MPGHYRYVIGAILLVLQVALGLNWMAVTPLFPIVMDELRVDRATVSLLFSMAPMAQAAFTIPAGMIAARIGVGRTFTVGAFAMAAGILVPLMPDFTGILWARLLFGIGAGLFAPLAGAVTVQWFRERELPIMNGLGFVCGSIGVSAGLFLTVPLHGLLGWRGVLALYGGFAGLAAFAWLVLGREGQGGVKALQDGERALGVRDVLKQPSAYWLALAFAGPISYYDVLVSWLPTYYNQVFQMDLAQAAAITGLLGLVGIPGSLGGGLISARVGLRRPFLAIPGALIGLAGLGTFMVNEVWVIVPFLLLFGLLSWFYTPVLFTIPMELPGLSPALVAVVIGMVLTIAGVAAFWAPLMAGFLTDQTGSYLPGFLLFAAASYLLLLAPLKLPETGPRGKATTAIVVAVEARGADEG